MSRLKAFSSSRLKGRAGSQLKAFGIGVKFYDFPFSEDVELTLEAYKRSLDGQGTGSVSMGSQTPIDIAVHDRWYHHCLTMMMSSNMRGTAENGGFLGKAYTGAIDPQNDDMSDLSLDTNFSVSSFNWNGWQNYVTSTQYQPPYNITANSVEFYGRCIVSRGSGSGTASGVVLYGPNTSLTFTGSGWDRNASLEWIMMYFPGINAAADDGGGVPANVTQTIIEVKMEITVP